MAAASDVSASDSKKRAAEEEVQVTEKKQKLAEDDLEDDSWADAIAAPESKAGDSSAEKPVVATKAEEPAVVAVVTEKVSEDASKSDEAKAEAPVANSEKAVVEASAAPAVAKVTDAPAGDEAKPVQEAKAPDLDSLTVCVRSISWSVEEEQFELDFEDHGTIEELVFIGHKGMAFVTYTTKEGVDAALKMHGDEYWGRSLSVELSDRGKAPKGEGFEAFAKGFPATVKEEKVKAHFSPCGEIIRLKIREGEEGKSKGSAFVTFQTQEALDKAVELDGQQFDDIEGSKIFIEAARGKGDGKGKGKGKDKGKGKGKGKGKKGKGKGKK